MSIILTFSAAYKQNNDDISLLVVTNYLTTFSEGGFIFPTVKEMLMHKPADIWKNSLSKVPMQRRTDELAKNIEELLCNLL